MTDAAAGKTFPADPDWTRIQQTSVPVCSDECMLEVPWSCPLTTPLAASWGEAPFLYAKVGGDPVSAALYKGKARGPYW